MHIQPLKITVKITGRYLEFYREEYYKINVRPLLMHTLSDVYQNCVAEFWSGTITISSSGSTLSAMTIVSKLNELRKLYEEQNICFGDRIVVKVDHSADTILTLISLWSLGVVIIPVKTNILENEIIAISQDCNARGIITAQDALIQKLPCMEEKKKFKFLSCRQVTGSDLALIIYTSGSTGTPKGIMLSHNNVMVALNSIVDYIQIKNNDNILCISPLSFDYGLYQVLFSFKTNCSVVLYNEETQPLALLKAIAKYKISILPIVPVLGTSLERTLHLFQGDLSNLRKITNTGGHLPETTILGFRKKLPWVQIYAMYGLTESKRALYLPPHLIEKKLGSVGNPMPGLEAKIFKEIISDGEIVYQELPPNEVGMLYVRGASVMQGYTNPDATSGVRIIPGQYRDDNWLATGDLFMRDEEGYFYFKGREKELIKQGGYCLYPRDMEEHVIKHPDVQLGILVGQYDPQGNEIAHLYIWLVEDTSTKRENFKKWLSDTINSDYFPRQLSFISEPPLNHNGKIDKKRLAMAKF